MPDHRPVVILKDRILNLLNTVSGHFYNISNSTIDPVRQVLHSNFLVGIYSRCILLNFGALRCKHLTFDALAVKKSALGLPEILNDLFLLCGYHWLLNNRLLLF